MNHIILTVVVAFIQATAPIPRPAPNNPASGRQNAQSKTKSDSAQAAPTADTNAASQEQTKTGTVSAENTQQSVAVRELPRVTVTKDWTDRAYWAFSGLLVIVGGLQALLLYYTLGAIKHQADIMERQTRVIRRQGLSMRRQTTILRNNVKALIASERAWVDGEVVNDDKLLGVYRFALKIRNLGKTPAQVRSYRINTGPLDEGSPFSPAGLRHMRQINLHMFVGSEEERVLEGDIDMDEMFPDFAGDSGFGTKGAFCVMIAYADVITGTPENRTERETSFVYLYTPLLRTVERLSQYNKYK